MLKAATRQGWGYGVRHRFPGITKSSTQLDSVNTKWPLRERVVRVCHPLVTDLCYLFCLHKEADKLIHAAFSIGVCIESCLTVFLQQTLGSRSSFSSASLFTVCLYALFFHPDLYRGNTIIYYILSLLSRFTNGLSIISQYIIKSPFSFFTFSASSTSLIKTSVITNGKFFPLLF